MSKTLEQLKAQNKVIRWFDFRDGSILDKSGNGGACTIVGSPKWKMTKLGLGLFLDGSTSYLDLGNAVDLQISTGTAIVLFNTLGVKPGWNTLFSKASAYNLFAPTSSGYFGLYDFSVPIVRNTTATIRPGLHCAASAFNGNASRVFLDGSPQGILAQAFTSQASRLLLGFDSGSNNGLYGEVLAFVLVSENLTDSTVSAIYNEIMTERGAGSPKTSNFHALIPADTTGKCILHWDMSTKTGDGKMLDRSGNGRHGTINGPAAIAPGLFDKTLALNGTDACYLSLASGYTNLISGNDNHAISFWVNPASIGNSPTLICNADASYLIEITNSGAMYWKCGTAYFYLSLFTVMNAWYHIYVEKTGATTGNMYLNGVLQTPYSGDLLTTPVKAASILYVGRYLYATYALDGKMENLKIFSSNLTSAERTKEYQDGAKLLRLRQCMCSAPVTLANVTAGTIPFSSVEVASGAWKISEDSAGKRWLECVTAGSASFQMPKAYGTWVFDLYKTANTVTDVLFAAAAKGVAKTGAAQTAYLLNLTPFNRVQLQKTVAGTITDIAYTAAAYIASPNTYRVCVTRAYNGSFSIYLKGGTFTNWTLITMTGGNPVTDTAITTSKYMNFVFASGDKIRGIYVLEGVVDPTVNPELIPG